MSHIIQTKLGTPRYPCDCMRPHSNPHILFFFCSYIQQTVLQRSTPLCPTADPVLSTYRSALQATDCASLRTLPTANRSATLRTTLAFSHRDSYEFAFLVRGLVNANSPDSCRYGDCFWQSGHWGLTCRIPDYSSKDTGFRVFLLDVDLYLINTTVCLVVLLVSCSSTKFPGSSRLESLCSVCLFV
jgi:hypothetical protein